MRKFYMIVTSCLLFSIAATSQNRYWVGPGTGGNWNLAANWAATSNGAGGASVPDGAGFDVIFDRSAVILVDVADLDLTSMRVTNNSDVRLYVTANTTMNLLSTDAVAQALRIDNGSVLTDSVSGDADFAAVFANNSKATIAGTWRFNNSATPANIGSHFTLPDVTGFQNDVAVSGTIYVGNTSMFGTTVTHNYLRFLAGSVFHNDGNVSVNINANYNAASTILITGRTTTGATFQGNRPIPNVIYDCPNQQGNLSVNLINRTVTGSFTVLNTNNRELQLVGNGNAATPQTINVIINGSLNISGNSRVVLSNVGSDNKTIYVQVQGDVNAGGVAFDLQKHFFEGLVDNRPTVLRVAGNIAHTAGTFTASSAKTDADSSLFIIEMNGTSAQTISSVTGSFDNAANQVELLMNNASGVTLLSPLAIGRLSFNSPNKGVLTTTMANILTINNRSAGVRPVLMPADNGYVDGPIRRRTQATGTYEIPVGKNGNLRMPEIITESDVESFYIVEYFDEPYTDLSVQEPLRGVSDAEYWMISRESGANAAVRLFLEGAVPGALASDAIFVARHNGVDWLSAKGQNGTALTPGTVTEGFVTSEIQIDFSPFTLGYGAQAALPIHLVNFNGRKIGSGRAQLTWSVSSDAHPESFEVFRSTDGRNFVSVGKVSGAASRYDYDFEDAKMQNGHNFYRLKMYDKDGSVNMSKVITIMNGSNGFFITSMIPTMVRDRARVNISSSRKGSVQLVVTDVQGRVVHTQVASIASENQEVWVDLSKLGSGAYHLTGYFANERSVPMRFVKQ